MAPGPRRDAGVLDGDEGDEADGGAGAAPRGDGRGAGRGRAAAAKVGARAGLREGRQVPDEEDDQRAGLHEEDDEDGTHRSLFEKIKNCCESRDPISKDTIK